MGAKMKSNKNSLVLLSSKRTKADTRTRADEAFALPPFLETTTFPQMDLPSGSCKEVAIERHSENGLQQLKQTILQHEAMFREQVRELHRLYQVQQLLMAEKKRSDSAIHTSSGPPSSNSSLVYSSDSFKAGGERSPWEATGGSTFNLKQAHQDFVSTRELVSPLQGQFHVNKSTEDIFHYEEYVKSKHQKGVRRTFDLERPAEEYIDIEAEEEKSIEKETSLKVGFTSNVSQLSNTPFGQSINTGKDIHSSISTDSQMELIDIVHRYSKNSEHNGTYNHFLFEHSGQNKAMLFPSGPSRMDCPSQEGIVPYTPALSTKSLLGGLLGLNHESQFEDKSTPNLQRRDFHEMGGRRMERQSHAAEAVKRSTQETSKQPHWLVKGQAASMTTSPGNLLTQNSNWLRPLPFFLEKQDELDLHKELGIFPGENDRTSVFQDIPKGGNALPLKASHHQCPVRALESQVRPPAQFSLTGRICQDKIPPQVGEIANLCIPVPLPHRGERGTRLLSALTTSSNPSLSAVDMQVPVVDVHTAPVMFHPGFGSRGTAHVSTTQHSLQQNGLASLMHPQQAAKLKPGSLPLAYQRMFLVPPHGDSVTPQVPASSYEVQVSNLMSDLGGCAYGMLNTKIDGIDSTALSVPKIATQGVPLKKSVFESMTRPADVELTLGPRHNEVNQTLEFLARDEDQSFFVQVAQKHGKNGKLSSLGDSFVTEAQIGKSQLIQNRISYSEAHHPVDGKFETGHECSQSETVAAKSTVLNEASCINAQCSEELQTLQGGLLLKATTFAEREGKEILLCNVDNVKPVLHLQMINECHPPCASKAFQGEKQGVSWQQRDVGDCIQSACDESGVVPSTGGFNCGGSRKKADLNQGGQVNLSGVECLHKAETDGAFGVDIPDSLMTGKSLEILTAMSSEARVAAPQVLYTGGDKGITGIGEACQSHVPGIVCSQCKSMVVALSSNTQSNEDAGRTCNETGRVMRQQEFSISSGVAESVNANDFVKVDCEDNTDDRRVEDSPKRMDEIFIHTYQAAEILLRLASDLSPIAEMGLTVDSAVYTQERSLEWFANIIRRENESAKLLGDADADAAGGIQLSETSEGKGCAFEEVREDMSGKSESPIDGAKEGQSHQYLDFFESVTLRLKANGLDNDEVSSQYVGRFPIAGECSFASHSGRSLRRGRAGRDFQREMLPSITSLSRQEITEDLQTIGGLVRSASEMVTKRTASCVSLKEDGYASPTRIGSTKNNGRTKGNYVDGLTKSSRKDGMEDQIGFPGIYSWGESTRRRRMRRHRSRWSLLPLGVQIFSS